MSRYWFATCIIGASVALTALAIAWTMLWHWMAGGHPWSLIPTIGGVLACIWLGIVYSMGDD